MILRYCDICGLLIEPDADRFDIIIRRLVVKKPDGTLPGLGYPLAEETVLTLCETHGVEVKRFVEERIFTEFPPGMIKGPIQKELIKDGDDGTENGAEGSPDDKK